jgi:Zn-dependent peptidase ImmA (M78 family)
LSEQTKRANRYRTTLSHEFGHVHLHGFLLSGGQRSFFADETKGPYKNNECRRETILDATSSDWMEWQAGYASGAILIPFTPLRELYRTFCQTSNILTACEINSPDGQRLVRQVAGKFQVSEDAARVRLLQRSYLTDHTKTPQF